MIFAKLLILELLVWHIQWKTNQNG